MSLTAWDRTLALRTATLAALALLLAAAVLVATDEREATFHTRLARLCALTPALASFSIAMVTKRLEASGDLRALAALGVPRRRALLGATASATVAGLFGALVLALGWGSLDGLFPPLSGDTWQRSGPGLVGPGLSLERVDGAVMFLSTRAPVDARNAARGAVVASIALFALALPGWTAVAERAWVRAVIGGGLVLGAIVSFHAVSAGGHPALLLVAPLALLAYLVALAVHSRRHELRDPG